MRPNCTITIDGVPASTLFMQRLSSCTVTDEEGVSSDTVDIVMNDDPPAAIPRTGAVISVLLGYAVQVPMGEFAAEEISGSMRPYTMRIRGRSLAMKGLAKTQRERHWDDATLSDVISQIAGENGLTAAVDAAIGGFRYDWIGQLAESDFAFLERLARVHDALFAVKSRHLVFASRGAGTSAGGSVLTPLVVTPQIMLEGSGSFSFSERAKYKSVVASYMDRAGGARVDIEIDSDPEGDATYRIRTPYASEAEARQAARAKAMELRRRQLSVSCSIVGDPSIRAGAVMTLAGCRAGIDGLPLIVSRAEHRFSKGGYVTALTGYPQG